MSLVGSPPILAKVSWKLFKAVLLSSSGSSLNMNLRKDPEKELYLVGPPTYQATSFWVSLIKVTYRSGEQIMAKQVLSFLKRACHNMN